LASQINIPREKWAEKQIWWDVVDIWIAGVLLDNQELVDRTPRRLWDGALYELHKRLMSAVDALNATFGKDTVRCGMFPNSEAWRTRFEHRSPSYTSDWRQLMTAV
jgi:DNA polymerase V